MAHGAAAVVLTVLAARLEAWLARATAALAVVRRWLAPRPAARPRAARTRPAAGPARAAAAPRRRPRQGAARAPSGLIPSAAGRARSRRERSVHEDPTSGRGGHGRRGLPGGVRRRHRAGPRRAEIDLAEERRDAGAHARRGDADLRGADREARRGHRDPERPGRPGEVGADAADERRQGGGAAEAARTEEAGRHLQGELAHHQRRRPPRVGGRHLQGQAAVLIARAACGATPAASAPRAA